ncbi:serine hydrolase domain-containing protein [Deinococcus yavapaiensis]|uniref:CubicO group peptidase (Beta-lactamase class C family) n=1 Tax=Deinococcus yavapaiensis KR-236 TaxID=694435 RepID=A0A318SC78_9DEIO|nr:serine hydrolase domain-containing protein [Deinococcus yavapaiensis]PYE53920.1 CubicO group peptidase (beta-lactamase class C family) [Deinococcus yavapaiensis KR-236]
MNTPITDVRQLTPDLLENFTHHVLEQMRALRVPGVAIGLHTPWETYELCLGVTSVDHPLPVTADTLFQIGSTTKTVTATILMRLVEAGQVHLDEHVRTYLPDLRLQSEDVAARVTVRQLLNHTAGWVGDYFENTGNGDDALTRIVANLADQEQITPLGEVWSYNNAAFYVAGRVIEVVTGMTYEQAARRFVLDPLSLDASFFFQDDVMTRSFAVGHIVKGDRAVVARPWGLPRSANPAGGLASSVRDQLAYARFHMGDGTAPSGERLLSPESMRVLQTPTVRASGGRHMAVSWFVRDVNGVRFLSHGGATNGQMSAFVLAPDLGFAFTSLTNADLGEVLNKSVQQWVWEHLLGIQEEEPIFLDVDENTVSDVVGRYLMAGTFGGGVTVSRNGPELLVEFIPEDYGDLSDTAPDPLPPFPARFCGQDELVATDGMFKGARVDILRDANGQVTWLRLGRVMKRQDA